MATRTADLETLTQGFHALSDETRLQILDLLRRGECCVCELTDQLDAAQSRLSFHLRTLKDAGLVTDRRDGRWVHYALRPEALEQLGQAIQLLQSQTGKTVLSSKCCS